MAALDSLRTHGWSYHAGYSHQFKKFHARAWKPLDKPKTVKALGGGDIQIFQYVVGALADDIESAALECFYKAVKEEGSGYYWEYLPIKKVAH